MIKTPNLIEEIEKGQFLLLLLEEGMYLDKTVQLVRSLQKAGKKLCYVCLSQPYTDISTGLKGLDIDPEKIYFIDVLSSHYEKKEDTSNCTFLDSPMELEGMRLAISKALKEKECSAVLVDTISTMLIYQKTSTIVRFTHDFLEEEGDGNKILYMVLKHDSIPMEENERLIKDLRMFADNTIDFQATS
jgi:hypothetical protein